MFSIDVYRIGRKKMFALKFPYNVELVDLIKKLPEKTFKFDATLKVWVLTLESLYKLMNVFKNSNKVKFEFSSEKERNEFRILLVKFIQEKKIKELERKKLLENKKNWIEYKEYVDKNYEKYSNDIHKKINKGFKLYPFQIAAALFINKVRNVLLAMDMGLGKTLSSIAFVEYNDFEKVIVITPNSLKFNYYNEVEKFTKSKAHIVGWKKNKYTLEESRYIILNYEFLNSKDKSIEKFKNLNIKTIDALICDESHRLKETKTNTFKNFKKIFINKIFRNEKPTKVFMTGTPAPNRAYELYSVLNQISPIEFATKKYFYENFCGYFYDKDGYGSYGFDFSKQNLTLLFNSMQPYVYRKKKEDVLKDLPDKIYQNIILEFTDKEYKTYSKIEEGVANEFINITNKLNPLTIMLRLRQYTSNLKINRVIEIADELINQNEKVIIVDDFKESLLTLKEHYKDIAVLHIGNVSIEERNFMVQDFQDQNGKSKVFLATIQTANYGLTLTASNNMFILSQPYSYGKFEQVADRTHRIGQKKSVNIYTPIFSDSIDYYIFESLESKRTEITKVIDNIDYESKIVDSVVNDVMNKIKLKYNQNG